VTKYIVNLKVRSLPAANNIISHTPNSSSHFFLPSTYQISAALLTAHVPSLCAPPSSTCPSYSLRSQPALPQYLRTPSQLQTGASRVRVLLISKVGRILGGSVTLMCLTSRRRGKAFEVEDRKTKEAERRRDWQTRSRKGKRGEGEK